MAVGIFANQDTIFVEKHMTIFINGKGQMKVFTDGIKIVNRQGRAIETISLVDIYGNITLSIGANQDIVRSGPITKIKNSGPIVITVKFEGGGNRDSTTNF